MQFLILLVGYIALLASASISLTDIQPITLFSTSCTGAYDTSIQKCDSARFAPLSSFSVCTQDCYDELNSLATKIQRACQDQGKSRVVEGFLKLAQVPQQKQQNRAE